MNPQDLLERVNRTLQTPYYKHPRHLYNALRLELGQQWQWPKPEDEEGWRFIEKIVIERIIKNASQE